MSSEITPPESLSGRLWRLARHRWTLRIGLGLVGLVVLAGVLFCTLLFDPFEADHPGPLVELVPASVSAYLGADDLRGGLSGWESSRARAQLRGSDRWRRFFASPLWRMIQQGTGLAGLQQALEQRAGSLASSENVLELFGREVAVAARVDARGGAESLLLTRVGFKGKLVVAALLRAVQLGQVPGEILPYEPTVARVGEGGGAIYVSRIADVLLVATSKSMVEEVLLSLRMKGEGSLGRSERFQAALRGEGHGVRLYADFERADKLLKINRELDRMALPFPLPLFLYFLRESVDLGALKVVSGRLYFAPEAYDRIYWEGSLTFATGRLSQYHRALYRQRPHLFRSFERLPREALFARALKIDPQLLWQFAQEKMGKGLRAWFEKLDRVARREFRIEHSAIDTVLLPLLGEEFAVLLTRVDYFEAGDLKGAEYPLPGLMLMIHSPDPRKLAERLDLLFGRSHRELSTGAVEAADFGGFRYSKFPLKVGFPSLEPCYAAVGEFFVLASNPLALQQLRDVLDGLSKPARVDKVSRTLDNLRLHVDFEQATRVLHDLAPKFAEEIVGGTRSMNAIRREMVARYGSRVTEEQISRVREVRTRIRAERMRKGLQQYRILRGLELEWTGKRTLLRCQARLAFAF